MDEPQPRLEIKTRLKRSNLCRVIRVDGVWGGLTPQLNIHMALFNERWGLTEETIIRTDDDGVIKDFPASSPNEITREVEVDVILSEQAAAFLRDWLDQRIGEIQVQRAQMQATQGQGPLE